MSMGNKYNLIKNCEAEKYQIDVFTKYESESGIQASTADFKYLLFNEYSEEFSVKYASENRLWKFTSLANLVDVLHDFKSAITSCIKLPLIKYILFYPNPTWQLTQSSQILQGLIKNSLLGRISKKL